MGLLAKVPDGKSFDPIPEGVYVAVAYAIYDIGTQHNKFYDKHIRQVLIAWELPDCRSEFEREGKMMNLPRAISQKYTLSLHMKAQLRKDLEAWRGAAFTKDELAGFDLKNILGAACQLQVIHNQSKDGTKVYANIKALMALPKGVMRPKAENPLKWFSFDEALTEELPEDMPAWIAEIIHESAEWKERKHASDLIPESSNELPEDDPAIANPPADFDAASGEPDFSDLPF